MKLSVGADQKVFSVFKPILVFLAFTLLFISLRSNNIFAVDGAYRCFDVYHRQHLFFHGNNHMLYPANVLAWTRIISILGFRPIDPIHYFSAVEIMNCLAAAGCLTIFYILVYALSRSLRLALGVTVGYGLSCAFLAQATNANEPMVGIFWSFLAICFAVMYWRKERSILLIVASGILFSLAMATYQSTVLLAPAALVLIFRSRREGEDSFQGYLRRLRAEGVFALSGLAGSVLIYGWAYWESGTRKLGPMLERFVHNEDARAYLGVSVGKVLSVPIGLVSNIYPVLSNYLGIRNLLSDRKFLAAWLFVLIGILLCFIISFVFLIHRNWSQTPLPQQVAFEALAVGFGFTLIPVIIWNPLYNKLWIQPLACLFLLLVLGFNAIKHHAGARAVLLRGAGILFLAGVLANLAWSLEGHLTKPFEIEEAERLAHIVGPRDLVVGEWDAVSTLYGSLWGDDDRFISFPTEAVTEGMGVMTHVREAISRAQQNDAKVYFLSLLDLTKPNWDGFLGSRCGVPYAELDFYRAHSRILATFRTRAGQVSLRELQLDAALPPSEPRQTPHTHNIAWPIPHTVRKYPLSSIARPLHFR